MIPLLVSEKRSANLNKEYFYLIEIKQDEKIQYSLDSEWNWMIAAKSLLILVHSWEDSFLFFDETIARFKVRRFSSMSETKLEPKSQIPITSIKTSTNKAEADIMVAVWITKITAYPTGVLQSKGNLWRFEKQKFYKPQWKWTKMIFESEKYFFWISRWKVVLNAFHTIFV